MARLSSTGRVCLVSVPGLEVPAFLPCFPGFYLGPSRVQLQGEVTAIQTKAAGYAASSGLMLGLFHAMYRIASYRIALAQLGAKLL